MLLAREAFFGDVMSQYTAKGYGDKPRLPESRALKEEMCKLNYPNYWNNPVGFEEKWNKCSESISQAQDKRKANSGNDSNSNRNSCSYIYMYV